MSDNDDVSKQETPEENEPLTMEQMGDLLGSTSISTSPKPGNSGQHHCQYRR